MGRLKPVSKFQTTFIVLYLSSTAFCLAFIHPFAIIRHNPDQIKP